MDSILLKAGEAFGSGAHESTQTALLALDALRGEFRPRRILDMGCGSGILSLVAAKYWPDAAILACDIAPAAIAAATENASANGMAHRVAALRSDGYRDPRIAAAGPYELIVCNILAEPLMRLSADLACHLAPGGKAVISGILRWLAEPVLKAHAAPGLFPSAAFTLGDWQAFLLAREEPPKSSGA